MNKQKQLVLIAILAFIVLGGVFVFFTKSTPPQTAPAALPTSDMAVEMMDSSAEQAGSAAIEDVRQLTEKAELDAEPVPDEDSSESTPAAVAAADADTASSVTIDVAAALAERTLGAPEATVKVVEYASLSCGHCATFHKSVFPQLKTAFIDTGKIQFTFNDYPLNAPAMDGAMIARCLPQDKYFNFIKFLFDTQEEWAYTADYKKHLRQNAKLLGGSDALVDACLESDDLKTGLIERMQKAASDHDIKSTPSFVVNGVVVRGTNDFNAMSVIINNALEESATAQ